MGNGKEGVVEVDADTIPSTWIPIHERMPELSKTEVDSVDVLVAFEDGNIEVITYTNRDRFWMNEITEPWWDFEWCVGIAAWMPLPEVPNGVSI